MIIYFNNEGTLTTQILHGAPVRQGNNFDFHVYFNQTNEIFKENDPSDLRVKVAFKLPNANDYSWDATIYLNFVGRKQFKKYKPNEMSYDLKEGMFYWVAEPQSEYKDLSKFTQTNGGLVASVQLLKINEDSTEVVFSEYQGLVNIYVEKVVGFKKPSEENVFDQQFLDLKESVYLTREEVKSKQKIIDEETDLKFRNLNLLGKVESDLIPIEDKYNLGSETNPWNEIYTKTIHLFNGSENIRAMSVEADGEVKLADKVGIPVDIGGYQIHFNYTYIDDDDNEIPMLMAVVKTDVSEDTVSPIFYIDADGKMHVSTLNSGIVDSIALHSDLGVLGNATITQETVNISNVDNATINTAKIKNATIEAETVTNGRFTNATIANATLSNIGGIPKFNTETQFNANTTYKGSELGTHADLALKYNVSAHNEFASLMEAKHNEIDTNHKVITDRLQNQIDAINRILASDNVDLDTIQEIVNVLESATETITKKADKTYVDEQIALQEAYTDTQVAQARSNFADTMEQHRSDTQDQITGLVETYNQFLLDKIGSYPVVIDSMVGDE